MVLNVNMHPYNTTLQGEKGTAQFSEYGLITLLKKEEKKVSAA